MTAAHCLFHQSQRRWADRDEISVVQSNFNTGTWYYNLTTYSCEQYVAHKMYDPFINRGLTPFDIAIVKIKKWVDWSKAGTFKIIMALFVKFFQPETLLGLSKKGNMFYKIKTNNVKPELFPRKPFVFIFP